ncbi:MAG: acetate kinase [Gammaproteobacteria bacterium CG_4_10_14_0_8_um_filter_38_16]|nr:MAG: acetate kinase [Gammaproteobacteria bacterium CG_4_10_14_0_8_um_filter_38_16]PJA02827.1 MAG: acetate kinase [Gammaproteobacteria bacterium CG_4_10_14_0_2_um_filter_38_22]PJB09491.1 MAG: acetate kinase [Gammaproteobacteria bacterium CG_4_9_14_3_um_filter_38_9]
MSDVILVINSGSSSIKFSIFSNEEKLNLLYNGKIDNISDLPSFTVYNSTHQQIIKKTIAQKGYEAGLQTFFQWVEKLADGIKIKAVGHRVVHGGQYFFHPTIVTDEVVEKIKSLIPLAPLHQPHNLRAINIIKTIYPALLQVACFDTTFHHSQEKLAKAFAIPKKLTDEGVIRYGFHGISYEYIASVMTKKIGQCANNRVIVAHLGNGASMCAIHHGKSVATTMGLTVLDGLMMGTRCGSIDPGVLLYLMKEKKYSEKQIEHLLYHESGLLGVSQLSSDAQKLLSSTNANAMYAIELFCYHAALAFGSLAVALGGCDALIFTAGIGENAAFIRKKIADRLGWMGMTLNHQSNQNNETIISDHDSKIIVGVIPTHEEYMIAKHTWSAIEYG